MYGARGRANSGFSPVRRVDGEEIGTRFRVELWWEPRGYGLVASMFGSRSGKTYHSAVGGLNPNNIELCIGVEAGYGDQRQRRRQAVNKRYHHSRSGNRHTDKYRHLLQPQPYPRRGERVRGQAETLRSHLTRPKT